MKTVLLNGAEQKLEKLIYRAIDHMDTWPGPILSEDITWVIFSRKWTVIPDEHNANSVSRLAWVRKQVADLLLKLKEGGLLSFDAGWSRNLKVPGSDGEFTW